MKNGILFLSAFVLMLSTLTAQVGGPAGGGSNPTPTGASGAPGAGSGTTDTKPTGTKPTGTKTTGTGDAGATGGTADAGDAVCCGRMMVTKPGAMVGGAKSTAVVLSKELLAGKNQAGKTLKFDVLDPNRKSVPRTMWRVFENTGGDLELDASKLPAAPAGKFYTLRVKYGKLFQDYKF